MCVGCLAGALAVVLDTSPRLNLLVGTSLARGEWGRGPPLAAAGEGAGWQSSRLDHLLPFPDSAHCAHRVLCSPVGNLSHPRV